ncbi:MAG: serine/threonine-protein kinase, partial [Polyangiales bacterium]
MGRYLIKEQLAAGGMGVVYRAVDTATGQECALKRIKPEVATNLQGVEAFEREYRVLAGINHPRIIRVHEYGVDEAGPFYTMELVEGSDLRKLAPLHYRDACRYLRDVAASLALLHARRLLHRDLSPRNVRVTADGHCKLLDFGALTGFGPSLIIVGTPPAIAPEAARGGSLDQRTDLYALGALAYWLLTGRHAYPAKRIDELPELWGTPPAQPSAFAEGIPLPLDELVLALLRHDPLARPASAAEVIAKLNAIAELEAEDDDEVGRLATSFLATPHFVARRAELHELEARVAAAVAGMGGAVLIEAAAGMGRTRLLDELAVVGQLADARVVRVDASMHRQLHGTARALTRLVLDAVPTAADTTARLSPTALAQVGEIASRMRLRHSMPVPTSQADPPLAGGVSLESWLAEVSDHAPLLIEVDNAEYA